MKNSVVFYLAAVMSGLFCNVVYAQEQAFHPALSDNFTVSVGAFSSDHAFKISAEGTEINGEDINFGNSIGVEKSNTIANADLGWKFGHERRWRLSGQYFSNNSTGSATLTEDVNWQNVTFREGTFAEGGVKLEVIRLFVGRSFVKDEQQDFGAGLGIHNLDLSTFIGGEARIGDENSGYQRRSADNSAPLPNLGAWYHYSPASKWLLRARVDWISADVGDYDGTMWNVNAGVNYQPWRNVGFDLSYEYFHIDFNVNKSSWRGGVDMSYSGPILSVTANW